MKIIDILVNDLIEDSQLQLVAEEYDYAIVYRKGHEFIDRVAFVNEISKHNFFIINHF